MQERSKYDLVVKDLFQRDHPSLLDQLTGGVAIVEVLNVELARVEERRADLVFLLADDTLLHVEIQGANDKEIAYREGIYCLLIGQKYRRRVRQVVLYIGQPKMHMEDHLDLGETQVRIRMMDIRELDAKQLMVSGRPGDLALAMLARGGAEMLREIVKQAGDLKGTDREKVLAQLGLLSGLRCLTGRLKMEVKSMGINNDFLKNEFVQDAIRDSEAKILKGQLATRFGSLPKWADERLDQARSVQLQRWLKNVVTANSIESTFGKK